MIFVDTGAFLARYVSRDQYHDRADSAWRELGEEGTPLLTSNFVLSETITLLGSVAGNEFAATRARTIYNSAALRILRPKREDEQAALEWFERLADQRVSFTDCVSFALMQREKVKQSFSFDHHFRLAGFDLWPE